MALYTFIPWKWTSHICKEHSFHQKVFFNLEGKMEMEQGNNYRKEIYTSSSLFVGKTIRDTKVDSGMDRKQGSQIPSFLCLSLLPINTRISFKVEYMVWMAITKPIIYVWGKVYISYSGTFAYLTCSILTHSCFTQIHIYIWFIYSYDKRIKID